MDRYSSLKEKFGTRAKVLGTTVAFFKEPIMIDLLAARNLDFVLFDTEHGNFDNASLVAFLHACRANGLPSIVRVEDTQYHLIAKTIYLGADGIMLPRTETVVQLGEAVKSMKFYPEGRMGCGGMFQYRKGETFAELQKDRFLMPQIESPEGVANLPAMLEEYGGYVSAVMIGPYDMSVMCGTPGNIRSEAVVSQIKKIFEISATYGKSAGIFCGSAEEAKKYAEMGANVFWACLDRDFFTIGLDSVMKGLGEI